MTENSRHLSIFLCHSSGDKEDIRKLYHLLCEEGFDPWLDEEKLLPGDDWHQKIPEAVKAADIVIVCLSRGSINKRGYVQKEIRYALDVADEQPENTIYIIPLKLEECDIPERLRRWQWVNLFDSRGYSRLIEALKHRATSNTNLFTVSSNLVSVKTEKISEVARKLDEENTKKWETPKNLRENRQTERVKTFGKPIILGSVIVIIVIVASLAWYSPIRGAVLKPNTDMLDAKLFLNRGIACAEKKDYECAIDSYTKAIKVNSKYIFAYYHRGISYDDKKEYDVAIKDYSKAIELNPKYAEAYFNRGVTYDNKRDYEQAIKDYTKAIELKPRLIIAYTNRGSAYASKYMYDNAINDYTEAIKLNPQYAEAYYNRGNYSDPPKL